MARQRERWRHVEGERPHTVIVEERPDRPEAPLRIRVWDPDARGGKGNYRTRSLGHRDRAQAKVEAKETYLALVKGAKLEPETPTLGRIFDLYERYRSPRKCETEQRADARRFKLFKLFLGRDKDPNRISLREWETFIDLRSSGAINAHGEPVPEAKRRT
jgi:hypothetical protein